MRWEDDFRAYLARLDAQKPVVLCGDLNVAHREIDLKNPATNHMNAGFYRPGARQVFRTARSAGFTDSFRLLLPGSSPGAYSWWSYTFVPRASNNAGWRIDYFVVSNRLMPRAREAAIHSDILGSDHCPVSLVLADA